MGCPSGEVQTFLRNEKNGIFYHDYHEVRLLMNELLELIENTEKPHVLCHIDLVPDNFIINGNDVHLIDWEYAANKIKNTN